MDKYFSDKDYRMLYKGMKILIICSKAFYKDISLIKEQLEKMDI